MGLRIHDLDVMFENHGAEPNNVLTIPQLALDSGAQVAISGPSGSGKSTLLYCLAGLLKPSSGSIHWHDNNITAMPEGKRDHWRRHHIGFIFQDFHLFDELSPLDNVTIAATFGHFVLPDALRTRACSLLEQFQVPYQRSSIRSLSRGERQRVATARALLFDPPLILADEPTASLDETAAQVLIDNLLGLARASAKTLICVSHDAVVLDALAQRYHLDHGHLQTL